MNHLIHWDWLMLPSRAQSRPGAVLAFLVSKGKSSLPSYYRIWSRLHPSALDNPTLDHHPRNEDCEGLKKPYRLTQGHRQFHYTDVNFSFIGLSSGESGWLAQVQKFYWQMKRLLWSKFLKRCQPFGSWRRP